MSIEKARDLVYAFADLLAAGVPFIGNASVLPCSRSELRTAFSVYLNWMYSERNKDAGLFERNGYGKTLRAAESCYVRVDDFHDIAPEDIAEVNRMNFSVASSITNMGPAEIKMMVKYPLGGATT